MKKLIGKRALTAGLAAMMLLTGCAKNMPAPTQTKTLTNDPKVKAEINLDAVATKTFDEDKMNAGYGEYTFKMLAATAANAKKANIMISPASIMMALDMCAAGAKDETLKELNDLFAKDSDPLEQQAFAAELMKRINNAQKVDFACANAVWCNEKVLVDGANKAYVNYIKNTFGAEFRSTKFDNHTHEGINKWVDEKTNHMIDKIFDQPLNSKTAMVLVNAIRFEGKWKMAYDEDNVLTKEFKGTNGTKNVKMLASTENLYFSSDKATGFIKFYEGDEYGFLAILPNDEKVSANDFVKNFSYEDYKKFINNRQATEVIAQMPEFKSDYLTELKPLLQALGVKQAFEPDTANFKGMADTMLDNIFISSVLHKTHIEVDRQGTKAAAVTAVRMEANAAMEPKPEPKRVICDRPYVYAIVERSTMNPIFIGTVNNVG
ncbi:MAG: serpin family protein [Clostridiales bacterium]|nr:serpin family protein [Clostridiales bacterium]